MNLGDVVVSITTSILALNFRQLILYYDRIIQLCRYKFYQKVETEKLKIELDLRNSPSTGNILNYPFIHKCKENRKEQIQNQSVL